MAWLSHSIPLPLTVLEIETMAAVTALEFALELGLDYAILEGDSEILMNSLMEDLLSSDPRCKSYYWIFSMY